MSDRALPAVITFLSDYGYRDEFVGVCHGVIARRCPAARVIDLTHGIPRHDVRAGALALRAALPYVPAGIHLAVVDPGVGAVGDQARRALAVRTAAQDRVLVGPDNGLLMPAAEHFAGAAEAVDIGDSRESLKPVSHTFHGRDVFAPVAAALAAGAPLSAVGRPISATDLLPMQLPAAYIRDGALVAHVLYGDHFGNLILDASEPQISALGIARGAALAVRHAGTSRTARRVSTFAEVPAGELLMYVDAQGMVALAVNQGSAAQLLGAGRGGELELGAA